MTFAERAFMCLVLAGLGLLSPWYLAYRSLIFFFSFGGSVSRAEKRIVGADWRDVAKFLIISGFHCHLLAFGSLE